ncbi:MAG: excinuclease ABC subunit UvrC [Patescibacteria group bacterium]
MISLNKKNLPETPGVYFYKKGRAVLYVGKASNLKKRVSSYFRVSANLSSAKHRLMAEASDVIWEETDSEIEALLLEAHYIKKYRPPYNVLLRDDKTFLSVVITDEEYPRILPTRKIGSEGTYYGPFTDARAVKETLRILRKMFPYRTTCKPNSYRAPAQRSSESVVGCLDAHLGLCPGVCAGRVTSREYKKTIRRIKMFFEGKRGRVISSLKQELKTLKQHTNKLENVGMRNEYKEELIKRQIQWLEKVIVMTHVLQQSEKVEGDVVELGHVLELPKPPHRIEGYDISHVSGTLTTASMVVFIDGVADKSEYKKFKIKTVIGANDVASLKEVLRRRFLHSITAANEGQLILRSQGEEGWPMPDLVVVDGGRPQLGAALEVWRELNLDVPLISLAKRLEEIFVPKRVDAIVLPRTSSALHLVQRVRDEAHRFCKSYHTLLRRKKLLRR